MARVLFGDVVKEVKVNIDRKNDTHEYFIAGEHMESENIHITKRGRFATSDVGPAFIRLFKPGQILYGSRRTYLKKVAVADFEGITSNTTFVLETKDPTVMMQELLPFIMLTDEFTEYAINNSKGSTNPYILFSDLAAYEFNLPDMSAQKRLVAKLLACDRAKEAYKKQLTITNELVKSQFIEMFGDYPRTRLGDFIEQVRGVSYKPNDLLLSLEDTHITLLRANNISNNEINFDEVQYVSRAKVSPQQIIREDDILMCASSGSLEHVGKAAICSPTSIDYTFGAFCKVVRTKKDLLPKFLATYFVTDEYRDKIMSLACGTNINNLKNEYIDNLLIPIPEMSIQESFVRMIEQFDKSKLFGAMHRIQHITGGYTCLVKQI